MNIKTLPISEARRKIFDIAQDVQIPGTHYFLTERGISKAVVLSADEYDSWMETMEVMKEFPDFKSEVAEAGTEYKNGNYITLDKLLRDQGYIVATEKYEVSISSRKKSSKRASKH